MRSLVTSLGARTVCSSTMRTCCIGLLLIITIEQSCCNEEEIKLADKSYIQSYEKLQSTVDNSKGGIERIEKSIPLKYIGDIYPSYDDNGIAERPAQYIIVRASAENCSDEEECTKMFQFLRSKRRGQLPVANFLVGGDGYVYESKGWDQAPYWDLNGLRSKAITVQFLGDYMKGIPPPTVIDAFETTLQIGVWLGKVSKNYRITSMRQLFNDDAYLGEKLDEYLMTWKSWVNATVLSSAWEYRIPKRLKFVFRRHWNASEPLKELVPMTQPVGHIMISDGGERCSDRTECTSWMKAEQTELNAHYGDLLDNFYIGEDGEVYEGRGWDVAPHWEFSGIESALLSVRLIGSFELKPSSERAVNSLKLLIETGVWLGKISPRYQIFCPREVYRDRSLTGETLYKIAEGWVPWWKKNGSLITHGGLGNPQIPPFVRALDWGAKLSAWGVTRILEAVDYVIVYDGDGRCFTRSECSMCMKREEERYRSSYGALLDNFYIGEDGAIYEGRGWRVLPQWHTLFRGISLMTVKFMGSFEKDSPRWLAMTSFNTLLKTGIDSGMISPNYRLITLRQTFPVAPSQPNSLENILKEMEPWSSNITMKINGSTTLYRNLIFPRALWSTQTHSDYSKLRHPVEYVIVGNNGPNCYSQELCKGVMKTWYDNKSKHVITNLDNFHIGEDGWAYEGSGWEGASQLNIKESDHNFLFVMFLGQFEKAAPSSIAKYAFDYLMRLGMSTGKLAPDYKIVSIRQIFHDAKAPGDMLSEDIKSWGRWSDNVSYSSSEDHSPPGNSIYVSRRDWNAPSWTPFPKRHDRILHVFVRSVGDRCFTREDCASVVRTEQNKSSTGILPNRFAMENFYVGEDGHVYEGRGWDAPPPWGHTGQNRDFLTVAFLGSFDKDLPSPKAVFAFKYLIKLGMYLGRIGSCYRLGSLKTSCAHGVIGEALDQEIKSWEMWTPYSSPISICPSDS